MLVVRRFLHAARSVRALEISEISKLANVFITLPQFSRRHHDFAVSSTFLFDQLLGVSNQCPRQQIPGFIIFHAARVGYSHAHL